MIYKQHRSQQTDGNIQKQPAQPQKYLFCYAKNIYDEWNRQTDNNNSSNNQKKLFHNVPHAWLYQQP